MQNISLLIEECSAAFRDTEEYHILENYRLRSTKLSASERLAIQNRLFQDFGPLFIAVKQSAPSINDSDQLYLALSLMGFETYVIAAFFSITTEGVRSRKHRLNDKLPLKWTETGLLETRYTPCCKNETPTETFHMRYPQNPTISLPAQQQKTTKIMETTMTLPQAIAQCYRKRLNYKDRAPLDEFWNFYLYAAIVSIGYVILQYLIDINWINSLLSIAYALGIIVPMLAVTVRRLHDREFRAWLCLPIYALPTLIKIAALHLHKNCPEQLSTAFQDPDTGAFILTALILLPFVLIFAFIWNLVLMALPGDKGPNNYGPDPILEPQQIINTSPLATPVAQQLKKQLTRAGLIDDQWNPTSLTGPECALLAKAVADRLQIEDVWQQFGQQWNINPPTLRSYFNRAMNQKKSLQFQDALKQALK